jgi:aldose 1-epimerase
MINADKYTPVDSTLIPNGELAIEENSPMDFRHPIEIGKRLDVDFEQLKFGGGYDRNWVLKRESWPLLFMNQFQDGIWRY